MPLKRATGQALLNSLFFTGSVYWISLAVFCFYLGVAHAKGSRDGEALAGIFAAIAAYGSIATAVRIWKCKSQKLPSDTTLGADR